MSVDLLITLLVLGSAVALFISEKLPVDVVALLALCALLVTGVLNTQQALSGFSSPATITVAAMFVLSAGLQRSGILRGMGNALARIRWSWLFALVMMLSIALISAFVNNTAAVAVFLPIVIAACIANRRAPSKYLIPLSFAAQFGGICTLVGTSTNLLVDSLARKSGQPGFTLFEFAPLGVIFVAVGTAYLMLMRRFLLPDLGIPELDDDDHSGRFVVELLVPEKSPTIGKRGSEVVPATFGDAFLLEIVRDGALVALPRNEEVRAGDRLLMRGEWKLLETLRRELKLEYDRVANDLDGDPKAKRLHVEVMIPPGSHLVDKTLAGVRFGHTYRSRVHGLNRHRLAIRQPLDRVRLEVGDVLLLDAPESSVAALRADPGILILNQRAQPLIDRGRAWLSLIVLVSVIGSAGLGLLPIVAAALLGCVALVATRTLTPEQAYAAVDWRVILLLAGVLPLGIALQESGGADWVAQHTVGAIGGFGPVATLAAIYILTAALTEVMSNNAAAVLVVPIALAAAEALGIDAKPLLVAVAFAASTSFATPVGYQTNTMVYSAGGYRFADFMKIGVPLNIIFAVVAVLLIPRYFPF